MRLLLDTHVFLWLNTEPERLGVHRELVTDPANQLVVSAASAWEIAIKYERGRLPLPEPPESYVPSRILTLAAEPLAIEHKHALAVASLPPLHRDPFDRLLVAQAQTLNLLILTSDPLVEQYAVQTIVLRG